MHLDICMQYPCLCMSHLSMSHEPCMQQVSVAPPHPTDMQMRDQHLSIQPGPMFNSGGAQLNATHQQPPIYLYLGVARMHSHPAHTQAAPSTHALPPSPHAGRASHAAKHTYLGVGSVHSAVGLLVEQHGLADLVHGAALDDQGHNSYDFDFVFDFVFDYDYDLQWMIYGLNYDDCMSPPGTMHACMHETCIWQQEMHAWHNMLFVPNVPE